MKHKSEIKHGHTKYHKLFFDKLGIKLEFKCMDDWYNVTQEDFNKNGGGGLLQVYGDSPSKALQTIYPEHKWMLWRFSKKPTGFWKDMFNQKQFFDWLGGELGYKGMDDWYNITKEDIVLHGGGGLLNGYYNDSPSLALQNIYPHHNWLLSSFKNRSVHQKSSQKQFFDYLGVQLGHKCMDDRYMVTKEDIYKHGGTFLSSCYRNSPSLALQKVYPHHEWMLWRFKTIPQGYWDTMSTSETRRMMEWVSKKMGVKLLNDWYRVSLAQIRKWIHIGSSDKLCSLLKIAYPQQQWNDRLLSTIALNKASQRELLLAMQQLFPSHSMFWSGY